MTEQQTGSSDGEDSFESFVESRSAALLRTAWLLTGSEVWAQDLVQTALIKTWSRWGQVRCRQAPEAYVRRVLMSTFLSWRRRRWWAERATQALVPEQEAPDGVAAVEVRVIVQQALRSLTKSQRAVVVLRYFEDRSEADTAALLGCSVGTVKSQTARAMARLRADARLDALWEKEMNR